MNHLHNIIYEWAETKIVSGTLEEWNAARTHCKFEDPVNLWIDSIDFPMEKSAATKGWFSHKLNGRAIKVQFIVDAMERVRLTRGPTEPGQCDGAFLRIDYNLITQKFKEGHIIAHNRYAIGTSIFKDPIFYCNNTETSVGRIVAEEEGLPTHSKGKKRTREIDEGISEQSVRLIEGVFGNIKRKFAVLSHRSIDDPIRLYQTVVIASAINNLIFEKISNF